jgi:hypothetical protein
MDDERIGLGAGILIGIALFLAYAFIKGLGL